MLHPVETARLARGWSQTELARRAGVTRQLVGTVETGRHAPRVDAALALARALDAPVEELFAPGPAPAPELVMLEPQVDEGTPVTGVRVGDRLVCAPLPAARGAETVLPWWGVADGVTTADGVRWHPGTRQDGLLVAGCDPALGLLAGLLARRSGHALVPVHASSAAAAASLAAGSIHAALVHGTPGSLPRPGGAVRRHHLARWQVGLAGPVGHAAPTPARIAERGLHVVQREAGAGTQAAFQRAMAAGGATVPGGPVARSHREAVTRVLHGAAAAVTMEPAALSAGLSFTPLEEHHVEIWVAEQHAEHPAALALVELLSTADLIRRLAAIPGYEVTGPAPGGARDRTGAA
ncbi:substrate-binding domain-containing protein [Actinotalea sp. K2]|uniref:substrate-binding domain-containing protein n=1 Tax=Actinotalea sp. K2 TaxID=2939438 RepID=UPI00201806D3|nr:substrate-binding domain-containing protein [Actinotalea sp. K2]MCL3861819.1 helix-turn-helix domain-containing protein [Actinotalea sp. K2]